MPALTSGAHGFVRAILLLAVIAAGMASYGLFLRLFGVTGWRDAVNAFRQAKT
jgi:putative peptidoglycan lipid II flippase